MTEVRAALTGAAVIVLLSHVVWLSGGFLEAAERGSVLVCPTCDRQPSSAFSM